MCGLLRLGQVRLPIRFGAKERFGLKMIKVSFHEAISDAFELLEDCEDFDSEYARGICELLALMYLRVGNTVVATEMVKAALMSNEW
jgi:hypothetical protein